MHIVTLILACAAFIGHGRRMKASAKADESQANSPLLRLAAALSTSHPLAGFNVGSIAARYHPVDAAQIALAQPLIGAGMLAPSHLASHSRHVEANMQVPNMQVVGDGWYDSLIDLFGNDCASCIAGRNALYPKDKVYLVGTYPADGRYDVSQYLGVYTKGMFASRSISPMRGNAYERYGYYEMVGDPHKLVFFDGEMWVVGDKAGRRIGVVCSDEVAALPGPRQSRPGIYGFLVGQPARPSATRPSSIPVDVLAASAASPRMPGGPWNPADGPYRPGPPQSLGSYSPGTGMRSVADATRLPPRDYRRDMLPQTSPVQREQLKDRVNMAMSQKDNYLEERIKETLKPDFDEWSQGRIATAELDRRKADAPNTLKLEYEAYEMLDDAFESLTKAKRAREEAAQVYDRAVQEEQRTEAQVHEYLENVERQQGFRTSRLSSFDTGLSFPDVQRPPPPGLQLPPGGPPEGW